MTAINTRDKVQHRAEMVLALFDHRIYKKILILVPTVEMQETVFNGIAYLIKHTKIVANKRDMKFSITAPIATKPDGVLYIATPNFERLRGQEWDMMVEFGDMTSGSSESMTALYMTALYASVRLGDDPIIVRWD